MSGALSFPIRHKGFLNGAEKSHAHSSYGILGYFNICITNINLPYKGAVIFIELHTTRIYNNPSELVVDSISVGFGTVTNKNTF